MVKVLTKVSNEVKRAGSSGSPYTDVGELTLHILAEMEAEMEI